MLATVLDATPPMRSGRRARLRRRPDKLRAEKGQDHRRCRRECRARGIRPRIARCGVNSGQRLGRYRWVVERTHAWLSRFRRLDVLSGPKREVFIADMSLRGRHASDSFVKEPRSTAAMDRTWRGLWMAALLAIPGVAAAQTGCVPPQGITLATPGTILAATNPTSAPLQYIDESGKIVGMDMDLGDAIAARLCLKVQYVATEFVTMIPGLKGGRYDMIDSFMYYTPERAEQVHMIPYGAATVSIVVPVAAKGGETLDDFAGKKFGAQLGSVDFVNASAASKALVEAGKPAIDLRTFPTYADLLQALAAGQLDGAIVSTDTAFYYRSKGASFFRIAASGLYPHAETIAFADPTLADKAAGALNAMKADGSYGKLFAPYHHCELPGPFKVTTGPIPVPVCPPYAG